MSALPNITPEDIAVRRIMANARDLAVLPQVVFKIMDLTGADNPASASALERAILVDPGFSARILTQANSAYFALPRKVASIREATMFVGLKAVRELAMTIGVFDMFLGKNDRGSLRRRGWWRLSLDAAVTGKAIAPMFSTCSMDEAYTCGLLHCIGKTLMDRTSAEDYTQVEELVHKGVPDYLAERAVFGCDHLDVNIAACRTWGFPENLMSGLEYLHEPVPGAPADHLRAITALSSKIALLAAEDRHAVKPELLPEWALKQLEIPYESIQELVDRGCTAIDEAKHLLR